jgi:uncharacterized protein (TIGR03437 family)
VGVYETTLLITSAGAANSPLSVPVSLSVSNPAPAMTPVPAAVAFNFTTDQTGPLTPQALSINTSGEPVSFTASVTGAAWLTITPASGISLLGAPATLTVSANPTGMLPGTYSAKINIASGNAANKSLTVAVSLAITPGRAVLTGIWPPDVAQGSPATTVTLAGSYLFPNTVVQIGTTRLTTTWISASALMAVAPASLLAAAGALSITATNPGQTPSDPLTWNVTPPGPKIWSVVNGASYTPRTPTVIAPGEIVAIFGSGLGAKDPALASPSGGAFPTTVGTSPATTTVEFEVSPGTWVAAPLIFAQAGQVNAVVPFNMTPVSGMNMRLTYDQVTSTSFAVDGVDTDPGIFTVTASGKGQAAVLNYNAATGLYSLNSATHPAARGSIILIYATGGGKTTTLPSPEGQIIPVTDSPPTLTNTTAVTIGGVTVAPDYAGVVPGSIASLVQINVAIPKTVTPGKAVPLSVIIGGKTSHAGVTIGVN